MKRHKEVPTDQDNEGLESGQGNRASKAASRASGSQPSTPKLKEKLIAKAQRECVTQAKALAHKPQVYMIPTEAYTQKRLTVKLLGSPSQPTRGTPMTLDLITLIVST